MNEFFIDSNIIIRFLTNDDTTQSPLAYKLFEKAVNGEIILILTLMIVAECTWVLSMKRYTKEEIADKFTQIISTFGIKTIDQERVQGRPRRSEGDEEASGQPAESECL